MTKQPKDVTSSEDDFGGYRGMRSDATLDGRARVNENPYKPFRSVRGTVDSAKRVTDERFGAWELGYNARCPEGWIVVRLDEHEALMRECEALRLERDEARRKLAIAIDVIHEFEDEKIELGDRLAKWERGEGPSTEAQHGVLLDQIKAERDAALAAGQKLADAVARVCGEGHPALAAWRALPGCCDRPAPEGETTDG